VDKLKSISYERKLMRNKQWIIIKSVPSLGIRIISIFKNKCHHRKRIYGLPFSAVALIKFSICVSPRIGERKNWNMIKTITIFKKVQDLDALLNFYIQVIFPAIHKLPGVICTDITSVHEVSPDISQELKGIQVIMETHFESEEAMQALVFSKEGYELMAQAGEITPCQISFFVGNEKRFSDTLTDELRKRIARIGYEDEVT
jgi:hypothetical protein